MKAMKIWIVTTGSSDVQLNKNNKWTDLFRNVRSQVKRGFAPTEGTDQRFLAPARVMGTVYSQPQAKQYFGDLTFPLLHNFIGKIQNEAINQIILILTDQTAVFSPEEKRSQYSAYWQDTCTLQPILETYLKDKFPQAELKPLLLKPQLPTEGLDDWNYVLELVQGEFSKSEFDFPKESTIYVSHQAGTPAISSAVQFSSLAKFGERVEFLVSSERDSNLTRILDGSIYLRGIRFLEAKALLDRHDYSRVKELLASYLTPEIEKLLDAAIEWNFANFEEFIKKLENHPNFAEDVQERQGAENWWWTAYESAYLAVVRLKQGNTVEAMFHSFRAVEGLLRQWVDKFYSEEIKQTKHPRWKENERWNRNLHKYGEDLYLFLSIKKKIDKGRTPDIWIFGNQAFKKRNDLFHQLKGLQDKKAVFDSWRSPNEKQWRDDPDNKWKARVLNCLNFVSDETFEFLDKEDQRGKVASLMVKVDEKLKHAIAQSEHTP